MPEPPTDYYNRLLDHRRAEYASKGLAKVPVDLMSATTRYLAGLRELLEKEIRENPTSRKVEITRVTYQRALASARDVVEARLTKIAQLAAQHVNLGSEPANLLPEERAVYDHLVQELAGFRRNAAPFLEGQTSAPAPGPSAAAAGGTGTPAPRPVPPPGPSSGRPSSPPARTGSPPGEGGGAVPAPSPEAPARAGSSPSGTTASVVVRVLEDRDPLALRNETVDLRKEDLLVLPTDKAELLVHAKVVERVTVRPPTTVT